MPAGIQFAIALASSSLIGRQTGRWVLTQINPAPPDAMGLHFRKSLRAGPFRFNLSKAGVGVSVGVPGFRVGMGPRGNYVHMGAGGIYYRASLPAGGNGRRGPMPFVPGGPPVHTPHRDSGVGEMREIESEHVLHLTDSSSEDLLREIRDKHKLLSLGKSVAWCTIGLLALLPLIGVPPLAVGLTLLVGALAFLVARFADDMRKSVVLFYDLDADVASRFEDLHTAFKALGGAHRVWHISAEGDVHDRKRNAGASTVIRRHATRPQVAGPPSLKTNVEVPALSVGRQTLYFLPDRLLVYEGSNVGAVGYAELRISRGTKRFIEEEGVPGDAQVVDTTWRYVNKSGGPDRRFSDNREILICLYEELDLTSPSGLRERIQVSRVGAAANLPQAVSRLGQLSPSATTTVASGSGGGHSEGIVPPSPRTFRERGASASDRYYALLEKLQTAQRERDYPAAIRAARESFVVLAPWVEAEKRSHGAFVISSIPCLEVAGTLMAVCGDRAGLDDMRRATQGIPDLDDWYQAMYDHENDARMVDQILAAVEREPGLRQRDLKSRISSGDGRRPAALADWLEKAGRLRREKEGTTYRLFPLGRN